VSSTKASVLTSFFACGPDFVKGDLAGSIAKLEDTRQRSVDFFLASIHLRHDPRDRSAVPGDDERLTALYVIQQLRQMGFGFGCLDFTHTSDYSI
jgi:hypothetical protein